MHYTSLNWLGQARTEDAIETAQAGVALCREAGDLFVLGLLLNTLAEARRASGELAEAEALAREGVTCKHAFDDRRGVAALV
jgi:hypothetical protein